ncbi:MAG: hypothetical protein ORN29_02355 [Rhodoferax sp.]|nr:hypothetical protein [Rhodoferax sp.]
MKKPTALPAGLNWTSMALVEFDYKRPLNELSAAQGRVWPEWQEEIKSAWRQKQFSDVLYANVSTVSFSIYSTMGACITPANGAGAFDAYSLCPARAKVILQSPQGGTKWVAMHGFQDVCFYIQANNPDAPLEQNHTEFAYDVATRTAYVRVIQYGKVVPACNRSIQFD